MSIAHLVNVVSIVGVAIVALGLHRGR